MVFVVPKIVFIEIMEILAFRTSVSSIALLLLSTITLWTHSALSSPLSAETNSEDNKSEESLVDIDTICDSQYPVSKLKQLSLYATDCKSNDKDFWMKNCRCSHEVNCQPPKCPQEMTTSTAKTLLPTTTLLSSILLSSFSTATTGTIPTSTTRYSSTSTLATTTTTNNNNIMANLGNSISGTGSTSHTSTTKSHEELPTPSKLLAQSNTNFIRLG